MPNEKNVNETANSNLEEDSQSDVLKPCSEVTEEKHPIQQCIDKALHRIRDVESVAKFSLSTTSYFQKQIFVDLAKQLEKSKEELEALEHDCEFTGNAYQDFIETVTVMNRLHEANLTETLLTSLFLRLFSVFDAFMGDLLVAIYRKNPELLSTINAQFSLEEILQFENFLELKNCALLDEIESLRRKSYVEQFEKLEKKFGLSLRKFDNWPTFVEMAQRRNLVTHCDGIVSKQYLKQCEIVNFTLAPKITEGGTLRITLKYLLSACSVLFEVVLKLGQTLWRKNFDEECDLANVHLSESTYEALKFEHWDRAVLISNFYSETAKTVKEIDRKIRIINNAIALKFSGKNEKAQRVLKKEDWTASLLVFRLSVEVLKDNFETAAELMRQAGKESDFLNQDSYHVWPLFKEFRKTTHFSEAYCEIFQSSFMNEESSKLEDRELDSDGIQSMNSDDEMNLSIPISVARKFVG